MLPATLLALAVALPCDPPAEPRKYLDWWYRELGEDAGGDSGPRRIGAWDKPFEQLESKKPDEHEALLKFLLDVARLSVADESAGKAPNCARFQVYKLEPDSVRVCTTALSWRSMALHYFGGRGEQHPELLPLLAWFLESEPEATLQSLAAAYLDNYSTADADKLRLKLAAGTHKNAVVIAEALKQLPKHKQKLPADEVLALCHHHRKQVREAARELNKAQGGKDPGAFDPVKAMQSPPVKAILAELEKWLPDAQLPAKDVKIVEVTVRHLDADKKERRKEIHLGWLIEQNGDTVELLLPSGGAYEFTHGGKDSSVTPLTLDVSTRPAKPLALADAIAELRKQADGERGAEKEWNSPDLRRGVVITGGWLLLAGHTAEAAEVLLSALDACDSDQHLLDSARLEISEMVGQDMHLAFTWKRDYAEALKLASRIDKVYRGTEYHPLALRFLEELPKRLDDFKTFTLPAPDEWKKLKAKLSREEQIDYLASRLRLVQIGPNFAVLERKPPVIDPYDVLRSDRRTLGKDNPHLEGLKLTLKDVPALSKHLKDDWITPHWDVPVCVPGAFSGWSVSSTRGLVAEIIDSVADHHLCTSELLREKDWEELTPKEIDAEIERINKWAKARETMPEVDLQWELYQREVKEATDFNGVRRRVEKLLNDKALSKERRVEVVEALVRRYEQLKRDDSDLTQKRFLELFLKYDPKAGLKFAEELVDRKEGYNLHLAARIVFAAGDKAKARPILGRELADEARGWDWRDSLLLLLEDGTKESLAEAAKLFGNKAHKALLDSLLPFDPPTRPQVLARCAKAGLSEPYRFYREQLDDEKTAERYATEVATEFAKNDAEVKKIVADHPQAADQIPHLKKWLDAKLAGKK